MPFLFEHTASLIVVQQDIKFYLILALIFEKILTENEKFII